MIYLTWFFKLIVQDTSEKFVGERQHQISGTDIKGQLDILQKSTFTGKGEK